MSPSSEWSPWSGSISIKMSSLKDLVRRRESPSQSPSQSSPPSPSHIRRRSSSSSYQKFEQAKRVSSSPARSMAMVYGPRMVTNTNRSESPQRNSMTTLNENGGLDPLERTQSGSSKLTWSDALDLSVPGGSAAGAPTKQVLGLRAESPSGVRSSVSPIHTLRSDQGPPKRQDSIPISSDMPLPDFLKLNCQWRWPRNKPDTPPDNHIEVNHKRLPTGLLFKRVIRVISQVQVIAAESQPECGFEGILAVKTTLWDSPSLQKEAKNEVERLKEIRHNHIVALVGWYTGPSRQGVLMFPAASWDL